MSEMSINIEEMDAEINNHDLDNNFLLHGEDFDELRPERKKARIE